MLDDHRRGPQPARRGAQEWLEDQILGAFAIELHGVDPVKSLAFENVGEPTRAHGEASAVEIRDDADRAVAAVAAVEEHGDLAVAIGRGAFQRLHRGEIVLAHVVDEALVDFRLWLDGENARRRSRARRHEQAVAADIGADVDEDEIGRDPLRKVIQFRGVEILRREQHPLFADIVGRIETHPGAERFHVHGPAAQRLHAQRAQEIGEPAASPAFRRAPGGRDDPGERATWRMGAERLEVVGLSVRHAGRELRLAPLYHAWRTAASGSLCAGGAFP